MEQKAWAQKISREEQEDFLADPTTAVLRLFVREQVSNQRRKLLDMCRTQPVESLRREAGFLDGLLEMQRHLEDGEL